MNDTTDNPAAVPRISHDWVVMKFGGTSVSTADRWQTICDLIRARLDDGLRPLIVHSAIAGMSNRLEAALVAAAQGDPDTLRDEIAAGHHRLATDLGLDAEELLADYLAELDQLLAGIRLVREASPRVQARVMALGELMATRLGAAYLRASGLEVDWVDARELLVSEDLDENETSRYLAASCDFSPDTGFQSELAARPGVLITQGFIARNREGEGVLLGRGGSDTSAAYLAARLKASRLEIWTDVPGLFSADPRMVPGARLLRRLSYEEAQEIASTGGSVLHPRCIRPVRRYGIPLHVLSTLTNREREAAAPRARAQPHGARPARSAPCSRPAELARSGGLQAEGVHRHGHEPMGGERGPDGSRLPSDEAKDRSPHAAWSSSSGGLLAWSATYGPTVTTSAATGPRARNSGWSRKPRNKNSVANSCGA